jgi:hypothetical protein
VDILTSLTGVRSDDAFLGRVEARQHVSTRYSCSRGLRFVLLASGSAAHLDLIRKQSLRLGRACADRFPQGPDGVRSGLVIPGRYS